MMTQREPATGELTEGGRGPRSVRGAGRGRPSSGRKAEVESGASLQGSTAKRFRSTGGFRAPGPQSAWGGAWLKIRRPRLEPRLERLRRPAGGPARAPVRVRL